MNEHQILLGYSDLIHISDYIVYMGDGIIYLSGKLVFSTGLILYFSLVGVNTISRIFPNIRFYWILRFNTHLRLITHYWILRFNTCGVIYVRSLLFMSLFAYFIVFGANSNSSHIFLDIRFNCGSQI